MRTDRELIELLLKEFESCKDTAELDSDFRIKYFYKCMEFRGLFHLIDNIYYDNRISTLEWSRLLHILELNKPKTEDDYWFNINNIKLSYSERVKFLQNILNNYLGGEK